MAEQRRFGDFVSIGITCGLSVKITTLGVLKRVRVWMRFSAASDEIAQHQTKSWLLSPNRALYVLPCTMSRTIRRILASSVRS